MANLDTLLSKNEERPDQKIQRNTSPQVRREFYIKDAVFTFDIQNNISYKYYITLTLPNGSTRVSKSFIFTIA